MKLHMLEIYYNFMDMYLDRRDFKLIQMDMDSMYMAISGTSIHEIVKLELQKEYDNGGKAEFLLTSKYLDRTLGIIQG